MMCVVGFTGPMLIEENKRSYHLMLQEFSNIKGLDAFFDVFEETLNQLPVSGSFRGAAPNPSPIPGIYMRVCTDYWLN